MDVLQRQMRTDLFRCGHDECLTFVRATRCQSRAAVVDHAIVIVCGTGEDSQTRRPVVWTELKLSMSIDGNNASVECRLLLND